MKGLPIPVNRTTVLTASLIILICAISSCSRTTGDEQGNLLIRNVQIVDPVNETLTGEMDILVMDGIITSVLPSGRRATFREGPTIDAADFYAVPGFVNTHTHLWQHLSRSVSPSEQLQQWIPKVYKPAFHMTDQEFYQLNEAACSDALLHGITTVLDWTVNFDEAKFEQVLHAMINTGLGGAVAWPHTSVFLPFETEKREFERIRRFAREHDRDLFIAHLPPERIPIPFLYDGILLAKVTGTPISEHIMENVQCQRDWLSTVKTYLASHGDKLQPADRKYLQDIASTPVPPSIDAIAAMSQNARTLLRLIEELPEGTSAYLPEDISYLRELASRQGPTYIPFLEHLGAYEHGYISVHSSMLSPDDIAIYKKHDVAINHNPESNAYLASGIAPISHYLLEGLTVSLGTDGTASNDRIDMLAAMRLMSHLQKVVALNVPLSGDMNSWGILRTATISGARAMMMEDRIGTIETGKEADIILVPKKSFQMQPVTEHPSFIANLLVNSAESKDIHTVISDGVVRVQNGRLRGGDEEEMAGKVTEIRTNAISKVNREHPGRSWREHLTLDEGSDPLVRYRAMYPNYAIDFTLENEGREPISLNIVISDLEKADGYFYAEETRQRFPSEAPRSERIKAAEVELLPGESFSLKKEMGPQPMTFTFLKNNEQIDSFELTLPHDPLWDWVMRANVYLEAAIPPH